MQQIEKTYDFPIIEAVGITFLKRASTSINSEGVVGLLFGVDNSSQIKSILSFLKIRISIILNIISPRYFSGKILDIHYVYPSISNPAIIYSRHKQSADYAKHKILPQQQGLKRIIMLVLSYVMGMSLSVAGVIVIKKMT